jgi:hypothetical protein
LKRYQWGGARQWWLTSIAAMTSQLIGTITHIQLIHIAHVLLNAVSVQSTDCTTTCMRKQVASMKDLAAWGGGAKCTAPGRFLDAAGRSGTIEVTLAFLAGGPGFGAAEQTLLESRPETR